MIYHDRLSLCTYFKETVMAQNAREKFATQVNADILASVRQLAQTEGRQLQALVDEAFADLIEKRKQSRVRGHVAGAYQASIEKYDGLYKKLAE
jgi:hypothetical protein